MKKYFIYNKGEIFYFECETLDEAQQKAIMLADHSEEIIVREYTQIRNYIKPKKDLKETTLIHKGKCWNCKEDIEYTDLHSFCPKCLTSM